MYIRWYLPLTRVRLKVQVTIYTRRTRTRGVEMVKCTRDWSSSRCRVPDYYSNRPNSFPSTFQRNPLHEWKSEGAFSEIFGILSI